MSTTSLYPTYCAWMPFGDFMDACKLKTPEQIAEIGYRSLDKVRAVNPDLAKAGERAQDAAIAADRRAHPDEYEQWEAIVANRISRPFSDHGQRLQRRF